MAVTNFIRTVWSNKIQDMLELECKLVQNCWSKYEGDCDRSKTVKILAVGDPTIKPYTGEKLTYEGMSDSVTDLVIDQANAFSFLVHDIDEAQSVDGLAEEYQRKAVHGLAVARDTYIANLIKTAANVTPATALTADAVIEAIDEAIVELRERNFDEEGVIEISPKVYNVVKTKLTELSTNNPDYIKTGKIGMYDGFKVIMSNNLATDSSHRYCAVRGTKAIAFAGQINEVEAFRHPDYFADAVRGLDTFGAKIIDEARIQVVKIPLE